MARLSDILIRKTTNSINNMKFCIYFLFMACLNIQTIDHSLIYMS